VPERPVYRVGICQDPQDKVAFDWWLRELLARFNANRCALKAVNGEDDERCRAPSR
jgi:hypothetical protein